MKPISYARHRFPPVIIQHAVWLYLRFTLSLRDVEDLLAERGIAVSYEGIVTLAAFVVRLHLFHGSRSSNIKALAGTSPDQSRVPRANVTMPLEGFGHPGSPDFCKPSKNWSE